MSAYEDSKMQAIIDEHSKEAHVNRVEKTSQFSDCEELKAEPADPRSIGERRLHIDIINCSDTIAAYTCHMIDDLERMRSKTRNPEAGRLISKTQTQLQQAYLWYKEVLASL